MTTSSTQLKKRIRRTNNQENLEMFETLSQKKIKFLEKMIFLYFRHFVDGSAKHILGSFPGIKWLRSIFFGEKIAAQVFLQNFF